jgi:hypothetical protein
MPPRGARIKGDTSARLRVIQVNIAIRWFVGDGLDEKLPPSFKPHAHLAIILPEVLCRYRWM